MKKSKYTDEQIAFAVKQTDALQLEEEVRGAERERSAPAQAARGRKQLLEEARRRSELG